MNRADKHVLSHLSERRDRWTPAALLPNGNGRITPRGATQLTLRRLTASGHIILGECSTEGIRGYRITEAGLIALAGTASKGQRPKVLRIRRADAMHQVVTLSGSSGRAHRSEPCPHCPWRIDQPTGRFPAQAFRHSAETAYDMSLHRFGCHMSGTKSPSTCAGFLLSGADHSLAVRLDYLRGRIEPGSITSPVELYPSYRDMAVANGVAPDDPSLERCR